MPTILTEATLPPISLQPARKRWTREELDALERTGLFDGQHLELIAGELFNKMGKKRPHVNALLLVVEWLTQVFGTQFVNQEAPIDVALEDNSINEPEPDAIVLRRKSLEFTSSNPRPEDLQLVIEVSDTTLYLDLKTKAALYARAGIVEYWVLDVTSRRIIVHRTPQEGQYASVAAYGAQEKIAPLGAPQSALQVSDVFPA